MSSRALASIATGIVVASCSTSDQTPVAEVGTPFTVWVVEERVAFGDADTPIANVRVAFDPAPNEHERQRERVVKTTEADGHVTFTGDFSQNGVSVTVLSEDHIYVTMLEASPDAARARPNTIGKPASDLVIVPPRLGRATEALTVGLRGNIIGKRAGDDDVTLAASALGSLRSVATFEPNYLLRAPRDRPFFLIGHETKQTTDAEGTASTELVKSFRVELPARSGDELLDLELPKLPSLPVKAIHAQAQVPTGASFVVGTRAEASVSSADSAIALGLVSRVKASGDGSKFAIDMNIVETDVAPERLLAHVTLTAPDGAQSTRVEQGVMTDGMVWNDFMLPPSIPDPNAPRLVRDPIPLEGFPVGAELRAHVLAGGRLLWILHGPPGGPRNKTFTIPYRDEVDAPLVQVFALSLSAQKDRVALPGSGELYRYTSTFRDISLKKR